ncbi:MAG: DUF2219 family protein [Hellea sp.]|nr:DUF2219 family protein [Hellea sp.]
MTMWARQEKGQSSAPSRLRQSLLVTAFSTILMAGSALGQSSDPNPADPENFRLNTETSYTETSDLIALGAEIELPAESLGSQIFDLDVSHIGCLTGDETCLTRDEMLDVKYSKSLTTSIDKIIDIELTPRASVSFNDASSSALVGALVRIGDDLKDGENLKSNAWYVFAGADAEAVSYAPNNLDRVAMGDFHLQDRIIVGDAQAGVGYRIGENSDISLGYFRREVTSFGSEQSLEPLNYSEDAAAISFTWRR